MKLTITILVLISIMMEVILRLFGFCNAPLYYQSNQYEYMYQPNQDRMRFGNRVLINEFSMRSLPLTSNDSITILMIGDSVIDGGALITHDSLASTILEAKLSAHYQFPIRVLNLACKQWGPDNAAAFVKEYGDFNASIISLVFSSHDAYDNMTFQPLVGVSSDFPNRQYFSAIVELFSRYLIPRYFIPLLSEGNNLDIRLKSRQNQAFNTGWNYFIRYCKDHEIELLVYLHADIYEFRQNKYLEDTIISFLDDKNVSAVLELDTEISEKYYIDQIHFNKLGQKHIANILYPEFTKKILNMNSP